MTLKDYLNTTIFGKGDKVCLRDHAGNLLMGTAVRSKIPKKYYKLVVKTGFVYGTRWEGKELPAVHEIWVETIDHELIAHREQVADAFCKFLHSFESYDAWQVAILCRELLEEHSDGFTGNKMIGVSLDLMQKLPNHSQITR